MAIDWSLLIQVRERYKTVAHEALVREREVTQRREAEAAQAHNEVQQRIAAKQALWQSTSVPAAGAISVASLRQTSAWSHALDGQIAQAAVAAGQAAQVAAQQQQQLEVKRRAMREAMGDLTKAEQMHERTRAEHRRRVDLRQEDATEDSASQVWAARKGD